MAVGSLVTSGCGFFASNLVCVKRVSIHQVSVDKKMHGSVRGANANQFSTDLVAPCCCTFQMSTVSRRLKKPQQSLGAQPEPQSGEEPASCISCSPGNAASVELIRQSSEATSSQVEVAPHCAMHELPSKSRVVSQRLAALLHKCVETTENVALPCLSGLRKTDHALNAKIPTRLSCFREYAL